MRPWATVLFAAVAPLAWAEAEMLTAEMLRGSCAALVASADRPESAACGLYLQGVLAGARAPREADESGQDPGWESRAARTRLGPRVREPAGSPRPYCIPADVTPETLAHAVVRQDAAGDRSAAELVDAALRKEFPCRR